MLVEIILTVSGFVFCLFALALGNRADMKNMVKSLTIGLVLLSVCILMFMVKDFQNQANTKEVLQTEPEPGYYKVDWLDEGEDDLMLLVTSANGDTELYEISKDKFVGWSRDPLILKVFVRKDVKLYHIVDALE